MKNISILCILILTSCATSNKIEGWRILDVGEFKISVPSKTKVENVASIDSYVAKIKGDGFNLMFDYGLYSPKMKLTEEEYIKSREWHYYGEYGLISILNPLPKLDTVRKINDTTYMAIYNASECLKNDSCFYYGMEEVFNEVVFEMKDSLIYMEVYLPSYINKYDFYISENDSIYKRVFVAKELNENKSGVYVLNKNSCSDEWNCLEQLALWTIDSVDINRDKLIRMLKSVELK